MGIGDQWPPDTITDQPRPSTDRFQDDDRHLGAVLRWGTNFVESLLGEDAWKFINSNGIVDFARAPIITGIYAEPSTTTPSLLTCQADSFISQPKATITFKWDRGDGDWIDGETESTYQTQEADIGLSVRSYATITNIAGNKGSYSNIIVVEAVGDIEVFELDAYTIHYFGDTMQSTVYNLNTYVLLGLINPWEASVVEGETYGITGIVSLYAITAAEAEIYVVELL